jgi:hypothetical protein
MAANLVVAATEVGAVMGRSVRRPLVRRALIRAIYLESLRSVGREFFPQETAFGALVEPAAAPIVARAFRLQQAFRTPAEQKRAESGPGGIAAPAG